MEKPAKKGPKDAKKQESAPPKEESSKLVKKGTVAQSVAVSDKNPIAASKNTDRIKIEGGNVAVVCRFRPLNEKEKSTGGREKIAPRFVDKVTVEVPNSSNPKDKPIKFAFDRVFDLDTDQVQMFETAALPIVESVLEGFNGTIFAYGQTSSGKTHTMQGVDINDPVTKGIIPRIVSYIFNVIDEASEDIEFTVKVSMIEIYMERIRDLLDPKKINLQVHEDKEKGVFIGDVTETYVTEAYEVARIMQLGNDNRSIGCTDMNKQSSRSHSCFIMTVTQNNASNFSCKTGKLYLVDLAGSEKISKTGATGQTLNEAKQINKSLSCLGLVINNLTDGKSTHIPYRDSKLTRILQESLGGNAKTCLIITCSPSMYNCDETISTLRFGMRAKNIKNKPKINKELSIAELKHLLEEAEGAIARKDRRIKNLEKIIKAMGGIVPEEKDDFIQRSPSKRDNPESSERTQNEIIEDIDEANAKIDALDALDDVDSSDAEFSDGDEDEEGAGDLLDEELDEVPSDLGTNASEKGAKKKTHKPKQKSEIDQLNETFAMLEKAALETKDVETMTDMATTVSVKTNTTKVSTVTTGTSLHVETNDNDTMTSLETCETSVMTDDSKKSQMDSNERNLQTDPVNFADFAKTGEETKEEVKSQGVDSTAQKETSGSKIQDNVEYQTSGVQAVVPYVDQEVYDKLISDHEALQKQLNGEFAAQKSKLEETLAQIDEQKKTLQIRDQTIHEQMEEIEQLTLKTSNLESSISEEKDMCESQKEKIQKYEAKIAEQEALVTHTAERINTIEKDFKSRNELLEQKNEELEKIKSEHEELGNKYSNVKHEYNKLKRENDMLVEKAASLHMEIEEMTKKNQKYKRQLVFLQEDQQKRIDGLKEQKVNLEMELIKYKSLLEDKIQMLDKVMSKDNQDSKELRSMFEDSYKKISEYEKTLIENEHEKKLAQKQLEKDEELDLKQRLISELEEKYSKAKHKIHEMKNEILLIQQKRDKDQSKKFKDEKAIIIKTLNDKNKKIEKLEGDLEAQKVKFSGLEAFLQEDQKVAYSKLQNLTKNMNQLKQMYSQIVSSESVKQEKHVLEKKLKRKEKKIEHIEGELATTRDQVANLKTQVQKMYNEIFQYVKDKDKTKELKDLLGGMEQHQALPVENLASSSSIVKSRKGGKGKNKPSNAMSFNQLMALSALNKNDHSSIQEAEDEDDSLIKEQDEEDEDEEIKIDA